MMYKRNLFNEPNASITKGNIVLIIRVVFFFFLRIMLYLY